MRNYTKFFSMLLVMLLGVGLWSCSDDDKISYGELPQAARTFLNTYYPGVETKKVTKDIDKDTGVIEYEVRLKNDHDITFNIKGEWTDVDAPDRQAIPAGIAPAAIENYLDANFNGVGINEISVEYYGYEVKLLNNLELKFSPDGTLLQLELD